MTENNQSQQVSLGCGTLILIALIVIFFSNQGVDDLEREVRRLRSEVAELKTLVEDQTKQIKLLQEKLDKQNGEAERPGRAED